MTSPDIFGTPLPTDEDYVKAIQSTVEEESIDSWQSFCKAISRSFSSLMHYRDFTSMAGMTAMMIEPYDESTRTFADKSHAVGNTVMSGIYFGGLFVPKAHGNIMNLDEIILPIPVERKDYNEAEQREHLERLVREFARRGLSMMGEGANAVLDLVEKNVIEDEAKRKFFRLGCGIVAQASRDAHFAYNHDRRTQALKQIDAGTMEIEWDINKLFEE